MRVLVTGVGGQLGYDVCKELEKQNIEHLGVDLKDFDITDKEAVQDNIGKYHPDTIIHCSAWTAVDKAEDVPTQVYNVNVEGTGNIANVCSQLGARLIYISTDYVFPGVGEHFYEVDDPTGPLSIYGKTKLEGEQIVRNTVNNHFIVRISWVFGKNGNNFVKTMLKLSESRNELSVVCDQMGSPTYTVDLAVLLCDMAKSEKYGTYHATNEGVCSWAEFATEIFLESRKNVVVKPIPTSQYPTRANRPLNSRMSKKSLDCAGFKRLPDWKDALKRYLIELQS